MPSELLLINGASSDIGVALIDHLLSREDGAHVLAHSFRSAERLRGLEAKYPGRITLYQADFGDAEAVIGMGKRILEAHGTPTGFVHLPALKLNYDRFTKFNWKRFEQDMSVQVHAAVELLRLLLPKMTKLPHASVVFLLSSVVHGVPPKYMSSYTVLKYAQLGLMRSLAAEYAATTVRVNAISPSMVETRFLSEIPEVAVQMAASAHPCGRNATTADLLPAFDLLLSPASAYIHGVDLLVAGGAQ